MQTIAQPRHEITLPFLLINQAINTLNTVESYIFTNIKFNVSS